MKTYIVKIIETNVSYVEVTAESSKDAEEQVQTLYDNGDLAIDDVDVNNRLILRARPSQRPSY